MNSLERVVNALVNIHPWHTLLVHFPSGFAVVGVLSIVFVLWRRNELFGKPAFYAWRS